MESKPKELIGFQYSVKLVNPMCVHAANKSLGTLCHKPFRCMFTQESNTFTNNPETVFVPFLLCGINT